MLVSRLIGFVVILLGVLAPDEGQWLPQQFLEMDWEALRARGLELTAEEIWHPDRGGVLSAAVQIGGCSAAFVSGEGLLLTNHHCGFRAIQSQSTVERNYLNDGFVAESREAELPAPGMVVYVVQRIEDVTARLHGAQAGADSDLARYQVVQREIRRLVEEGEKSQEGVSCQVASFFNGRQYHLYYRTRIPDVRLVYAPPRAVGEYGGEEDNWMWPRHAGDFTFFRAYVGKDGRPAPHSKDNVPYRPPHHLRVASQGVKEGELLLILGYPGRTERYLSSLAVRARQDQIYPLRLHLLTKVIQILERAAEADPERALALASRIKSLANVQKNALGMVKGLARNAVVKTKKGEEAAFTAWVEGDSGRQERYGTVLADLMNLDRQEAAHLQHDEVLSTVMRQTSLLSALVNACLSLEESARPSPEGENQQESENLEQMASRVGAESLTRQLEEIEGPILAEIFEVALSLREGQKLAAVSEAAGSDMDGATLAAVLLETSAMKEADARRALFREGWEVVRQCDDPLIRLARGLGRDLRSARERSRTLAGQRLLVGRRWIEAQEEWRGVGFYPDANGTLRISIANVKGYRPRDGVVHTPLTTLRGLLEKETGEEPFKSPVALLQAAQERDLGRFADPNLGDVPVCFLADGDTTGGNSGSPVVNGRGELVGVNFDRVFENVAGDFGWNQERSRNIAVDVRFILWNLDRVLPAPGLLGELGF